MRRRDFMKLGIAVVALPLPDGRPRLDRSWPLDIREGFANVERADTYEILLDGKRVRGAVAVSPETGHVLKFRFYSEGVPRAPGMPLTETVLKSKECRCERGMHVLTDAWCIPYEVRRGRVEVRRT